MVNILSENFPNNPDNLAFDIPGWKRISTGCKKIDCLLHGGIAINGINEISGESGVGKTQFCLQLALMVQLPKVLGGLEKNVVYICTEDPFPSKRLKQLEPVFLNRFERNEEVHIAFADNIFVEHIPDFEQLKACLYVRLQNLVQKLNIGLIIIDSIAGVFRSYNESRNYQSRSEEFQIISKKLHEFCNQNNVAIICTNQVSDNLETGGTNPSLGLAWSNLVTSRFYITRSFNRPLRKLKVVFAPDLPNSSCNFFIEENGVIDGD